MAERLATRMWAQLEMAECDTRCDRLRSVSGGKQSDEGRLAVTGPVQVEGHGRWDATRTTTRILATYPPSVTGALSEGRRDI